MSAYDAWMSLQMKAISGDAAAQADIDKVAAAAGDNPTDAERAEVWQRMLEEKAEKKEQPEEQPEEPATCRPRLNTEDVEEVHHDDEGLPQMRMVNDKAPDGRLEGGVLVCDPLRRGSASGSARGSGSGSGGANGSGSASASERRGAGRGRGD